MKQKMNTMYSQYAAVCLDDDDAITIVLSIVILMTCELVIE
jgi:hypothetical protein